MQKHSIAVDSQDYFERESHPSASLRVFFSLVAGKKSLPAGSAARACDKLSRAFSVILPVRISRRMKSGRYCPEGEKWRITRPRPCSGGQSDLGVFKG